MSSVSGLMLKVVPCRKFTRVIRIFFLSSVALFMLTLLSTCSAMYQLQDAQHLGLTMCPACYGVSMCTDFTSGKITYIGWSNLRTIHFFNVKNVYYARHTDSGREMVLKKLATDKELEEIDVKLCREASLKYPCEISKSLNNTVSKNMYNSKYKLTAAYLRGVSDLFACPSERLVQRMIDKYTEAKLNGKTHNMIDMNDKLMLITTLMINPEPLMLQMFPAEDGWPFPKYYGACGRYIAEEYVGPTLDEVVESAGWEERVGWAHEAALIAQHLTNNTSHFALYLTDVSLDNFAVDRRRRHSQSATGRGGQLKLIDLENIIVVDIQQLRKDRSPADWAVPMQSSVSPCGRGPEDANCLSFSEAALCSHAVSDHNYLAVCKNLLTRLLHHMPKVAVVQWRLDYLLEQCVQPTEPPRTRYHVWQQLLQVLNSLRTMNIDISLN